MLDNECQELFDRFSLLVPVILMPGGTFRDLISQSILNVNISRTSPK